MQEHEKSILSLILLGALIALGQMLVSSEPMTGKLFFGRIILGSATSMVAAAALIWIPDISPVAIAGLGAALGIIGHQTVEIWLRKKGSRYLSGKGKLK
ncbi:holin [Rahnella aquatilis]|nr:holin [Rahnella aquatilis]